ncbi:MAG: DnaA N-terminal domain-containing protein, partial [Candidatus Omnitrophica bacterium]|nr:DnaA N-terminal domain-containing protein [Candidatus Omnitrophota bacterium]
MSELISLWHQAQQQIRERLGATAFSTWIEPLKAVTQGENQLILQAPDTFFRDWVQKNYSAVIEN